MVFNETLKQSRKFCYFASMVEGGVKAEFFRKKSRLVLVD